jgi:hypothetical protein
MFIDVKIYFFHSEFNKTDAAHLFFGFSSPSFQLLLMNQVLIEAYFCIVQLTNVLKKLN